MKPLTNIRNKHFNGQNYVANVSINQNTVNVIHRPVRGESGKDIENALIQLAKEEIFNEAIKNT